MALFSFFVLSANAQVPPTDPCVQNQVRLSLTDARDGSKMGVSWATSNSTTPHNYAAVVRYGPASGPGAGRLTMTTNVADSRNYSVCGAASPFLHFTTMTGLQAGADYFYSIDGGAACGATAPALFTAPKAVGADPTAYPFTMLAYADMGISNSQFTTAFLAQRVAAGGVDVIVHAGDISYADNRGCPYYDTVQNNYYNEIQQYAAHVPVMCKFQLEPPRAPKTHAPKKQTRTQTLPTPNLKQIVVGIMNPARREARRVPSSRIARAWPPLCPLT